MGIIVEDPMQYMDWVDSRDDPDDEYWDEFVQREWPDTYDSCKWRKSEWDD